MRCLILLAIVAAAVSAYPQNVTVKGTAVCNKKRMADIKVQLWEKDTLDPDDLLKESNTDAQGEFELFGEEDEAKSIHPYLLVHHSCNTKPGCVRTVRYEIPKAKIGSTYDMTYVTLDIVGKNDKEKCK